MWRLNILLALSGPASAAVLPVGAGQPFDRPSAAAAAARDGDTVLIAPGSYYDCAVWHASRLTIAASGPGAVLTDTACQGKAAFVIDGDDVTVRGLTFQRIRVPDGNGAGIRAEGGRLRVQASRFENDEVGILAATGALDVEDCRFARNGIAGPPARGADILAGPLSELRVAGSQFAATRGRISIESAAAVDALTGNGFAPGTVTPVVLLRGGGAEVTGNTATLPGPGTFLHREDGTSSTTGAWSVVGNALRNTGEPGAILVRDWSSRAPALRDNAVPAGDVVISSAGTWRHWLRERVGQGVRLARHVVGRLLHLMRAAMSD